MPKIIRVTANYGAERSEGEHSFSTGIYIREDDRLTRRFIGVYARMERLEDTWEPAEVNWSALGSVTPQETAEFAKALAWAAREAKRIDRKTGAGKPTKTPRRVNRLPVAREVA